MKLFLWPFIAWHWTDSFYNKKKPMGLKLSPLKTSSLAAVPSVNRKLLTYILTNVPTHPAYGCA